MGRADMNDAAYGSRFIAGLRERVKSTAGWDYATISALEAADRDGVVAILSDRDRPSALDEGVLRLSSDSPLPSARAAILHLARTATPEELARAVASELQSLYDEGRRAALAREAGLWILSPFLGGFL